MHVLPSLITPWSNSERFVGKVPTSDRSKVLLENQNPPIAPQCELAYLKREGGRARRNMRVFIADDSVMVNRLSAMLSELDGMEVVGHATCALEAMPSIRKLHPDAVILGLGPPGGSGFDLLEIIKQEKPTTIVMILTNLPYPQYRKRCRNAGADFFLDKSSEFIKVPTIFRKLALRRRA